MDDTELLIAISNMLDKKMSAGLKPINNRLKCIETDVSLLKEAVAKHSVKLQKLA